MVVVEGGARVVEGGARGRKVTPIRIPLAITSAANTFWKVTESTNLASRHLPPTHRSIHHCVCAPTKADCVSAPTQRSMHRLCELATVCVPRPRQ